MRNAFRSLAVRNYRTWAMGALVSNVGTWMQRVAQDWLVLVQLTHRNATSVGIVTALQMSPQVLLLPWTGAAADRLDRRKLLFATQATMGLLALGLSALTLLGWVRLWHVYLFAFLLGCATAFDAPARHTFVAELVPEPDLPNAVALNSTSFNAARMLGPAVAGVLVAAVGSGWVFFLNALSFGAVLVSLALLKPSELHAENATRARRGGLREGARYLWSKPELRTAFLMLFFIGTLGLNFPIYISTMSVLVFQRGAGDYGLATSVMAIGSLIGAFATAVRRRPGTPLLVVAAGAFGVCCAVAASMPSFLLFAVSLIAVGVSVQTFTTSANAFVQLSTDAAMRGRVMSLFLAVALGATPIGAPIVGWVADRFGARWALGMAAAGGLVAAACGLALGAIQRTAPLSPHEQGT